VKADVSFLYPLIQKVTNLCRVSAEYLPSELSDIFGQNADKNCKNNGALHPEGPTLYTFG